MYIIFSVILLVCQALIIICPLLYKASLQLNWMPLIALAALWLNWFLYHGKKGLSAFGVILWILFAFLGLMALLSAVFTVFSFGDREQKKAPVVIGKAESPQAVAMVYHPGGSNLPKTVNTLIAEKLADSGYRVTLYTAHTELNLNPKKVSVIGLASPVYGGAIRPPLAAFINKTDLTGVKCFVVITGWVKSAEATDIEKVKKLIESKGGIFIGGKKFTASDLKQPREIGDFVESIKDKF